MEQTVSEFLKALNIPISAKYVQKLIHAHPDFPSLLSVADVFERLGINHVARRVKSENLTSIPFPYLLPLDQGRGDLLLIKNVADLSKHKDALKQWGGVVLQAERTKRINDIRNNELFTYELTITRLIIFLAVILAAVIFLPLLKQVSWLSLALLATALAGVATSYFLIAKELGIANKTIDAFCNTGKNINCDKVLKADIQIFGISLSEAACTYFLFQVVAITITNIFPSVGNSFFGVLLILSALTLPVIGFSLYYQKFIAKTWCKLCLVVVALLFVQASLFAGAYFIDGLPAGLSLQPMPVVILLLLVAGIGTVVKLIKAIIEHTSKLSFEDTGNRIKHNADVFISLLNRQNRIDKPFLENEMVAGNPQAPLQIVMVSNLYCNPCKEKHKVVEQLLACYPDKVQVSFRFVKSATYAIAGLESGSYLLGAWLTHAHGQPEEGEKTLTLLHDWFQLWNLEKFAKKWSVDETFHSECTQVAEAHNAWAAAVEVKQTPTFFINGNELPKEYSVADFMAMVPGLASKIKKNVEVAMQPV